MLMLVEVKVTNACEEEDEEEEEEDEEGLPHSDH